MYRYLLLLYRSVHLISAVYKITWLSKKKLSKFIRLYHFLLFNQFGNSPLQIPLYIRTSAFSIYTNCIYTKIRSNLFWIWEQQHFTSIYYHLTWINKLNKKWLRLKSQWESGHLIRGNYFAYSLIFCTIFAMAAWLISPLHPFRDQRLAVEEGDRILCVCCNSLLP